jgi:hypothetical protein
MLPKALPYRPALHENGREHVKMAVSLGFWHVRARTEIDFQPLLENQAARHFQVFSVFTLYGGQRR